MIFTGSEHYIFYAYNYKPSPGLKGQWHCPPNPLGFPSVPSERVFLFLTVFLLRISLGSFSFIFLLFVSVSIPASEGWWLRVIGISLTDLFSTCTLSQWFATLVLNSCLLFHKAASLLLLFLKATDWPVPISSDQTTLLLFAHCRDNPGWISGNTRLLWIVCRTSHALLRSRHFYKFRPSSVLFLLSG